MVRRADEPPSSTDFSHPGGCGRAGCGVNAGAGANNKELPMQSLRTLGACLLVTLASLTIASPAARADDDNRSHNRNWRHGYHNNWYGGYNRPYYWNYGSSSYNPYRA